MKKLAILGTLVLLISLAAVPAASAQAVTGCTFTTAATKMILNADCAATATILIPDGFTLDGNGHTITAVDPPDGHFLGAVVNNAGATASVMNLTIQASGLANVCDAGANRLRAILFEGASGTIEKNTVLGVNQGASGCQEGNAIEVRNAPFDGTHPNTKTVNISGNALANYQKNGITASGDVNATIRDNTVAGAGPVSYIAQNGIQVGFGGSGEVRGNIIVGNWYTGCSNKDAAKTGCVPWVSAGLLLYDVDATAIKHSENLFRDNQRNLLLVNSQSLNPGP